MLYQFNCVHTFTSLDDVAGNWSTTGRDRLGPLNCNRGFSNTDDSDTTHSLWHTWKENKRKIGVGLCNSCRRIQ